MNRRAKFTDTALHMPDSSTDGPKSDDNFFDDYSDEELVKMAGDDLVEELRKLAATRVVWNPKTGEWE